MGRPWIFDSGGGALAPVAMVLARHLQGGCAAYALQTGNPKHIRIYRSAIALHYRAR